MIQLQVLAGPRDDDVPFWLAHSFFLAECDFPQAIILLVHCPWLRYCSSLRLYWHYIVYHRLFRPQQLGGSARCRDVSLGTYLAESISASFVLRLTTSLPFYTPCPNTILPGTLEPRSGLESLYQVGCGYLFQKIQGLDLSVDILEPNIHQADIHPLTRNKVPPASRPLPRPRILFIGRRLLDSIATRSCTCTLQSTEVLIFSTASAAVFACSIWYLRRMAPDRSAGTDTAPKEKNVKVFASPQSESYDPKTTDPPLLKKHSEYKSYTTSRFTYSGLRIFYRRHTQADQLPNAPPLPLLVCLHGLGGSVAQFHPLLTSLTNISNCLAIDLPGCGASDFTETSWDAYKTDALVELLELIIEDYRDKAAGQGVVLIAHSMGCSLGARLASKAVPHTTDLHNHVMGLVAICPESGPPTEQQVSFFRKLLWIPGPLFDLWRAWDRRGGPESASVCRFVGADADAEAKRLQHLYNNQSRTPVWRRMASGCLPVYENGVPKGGLPGKEVWAGLDIPVYLIGGELDNVTKPAEVGKIVEILKVGAAASDSEPEHQGIVDAAAPVDTTDANASVSKAQSITDITEDDFTRDRRLNNTDESQEDPDPSTPSEPSSEVPPLPQHPQKVVKSIILPAPATHALLYTPSTARVLAGLVSDFLASHVSGRLSLGWQLQYLSREGKWDVKNLEKWKKVAPVSEPIAGVFRAMKTLRELDETHTPSVFVKNWGHVIKDIVDISHDSPVYDPRGLETGGVQYHKLPTVSKIPPTDVEVNVFIATVDRLRAEQEKRAKEQNWDKDYVIGVHCHYGFNRTGYFIVCYIVERCGYSVKDAIDAFAKARPNGIRHSHFLDNLHLRYSGLKADGTSIA